LCIQPWLSRLVFEASQILPGGRIAVVERNSGRIHAFWAAGKGVIHHCQLIDGIWQPFDKISGAHLVTRGGGIVAVSRSKEHVECFWIDGTSIQASFRYYNTVSDWQTWHLPDSKGKVMSGSPLVATTRNENDMKYFGLGLLGPSGPATSTALAGISHTKSQAMAAPMSREV
jgi:hypothetical protein